MLILCCGNPDRGDDGAGAIVAQRLKRRAITAEICTGEASHLLEKWQGISDVIVVDAVITGGRPGTIHEWNASETNLPPQQSVSTHGLGVAAAVEIARTLGKLPRRLRVYGIEAEQFEPLTGISPIVRQAAEELAVRIAAECRAASACEP
ncbi:MAG TPA: hydrogenase maturation protease [Silvibacterium sp.]|nr:hydrogenase maturation protease [Silvibacterium sp.]